MIGHSMTQSSPLFGQNGQISHTYIFLEIYFVSSMHISKLQIFLLVFCVVFSIKNKNIIVNNIILQSFQFYIVPCRGISSQKNRHSYSFYKTVE